MEKKLNNKMKNNFFYSKSGLSASILFNKLCETARIYSNYERLIKYTYRVNARRPCISIHSIHFSIKLII